MSLWTGEGDPFEGLRTFPREPAVLRHHLSHIHHLLQTRYDVPAETAELALQPDQASQFDRYYHAEVQRVIQRYNKVTRRALQVHVDPSRLLRGMQLQRRHGQDPGHPSPGEGGGTDSAWLNALTASTRVLREPPSLDRHRLVAAPGDVTPAAQVGGLPPMGSHALHGAEGHPSPGEEGLSTGARDSEGKPRHDSCLFSTPPEFRGFTVPMMTPTDSEQCSPMGH